MKGLFTTMVNIKYRGLLLTLLIFRVFGVQSQTLIHENIVPPSPHASDLGKYSELTANNQLGAPSISIPVYHVEGKSIDHNISLSYDATGRKVSEIASWVGLGWTLQAGGVITRTVRGLNDEHPDGYFNRYKEWKEVHEPVTNQVDYDASDVLSQEYSFLFNCFGGIYDLLPDSYNFNFDGYSGTILFDGLTKEPIIIPYQGMKIEQNPFSEGDSEISWKIITPDGAIYTFKQSDAEVTHTSYAAGSGVSFESAWYLSSIEDFNQTEKISFGYVHPLHETSSARRYGVYNTVFQPNVTSFQEECEHPIVPSSQFQETNRIERATLGYIYYHQNGENMVTVDLDFLVGQREDQTTFTGTLNQLNSISIKDGKSPSSDFMEIFSFDYGYLGTDKGKRLNLESVTQWGHPPYTFEYANESKNYPDYESFSIDHWGYWNQQLNQTLIPTAPSWVTSSGYFMENGEAQANRNASLYGSLFNMLTKVVYPTGGSASYTYETHLNKYVVQNCKVTKIVSVVVENGSGMDATETEISNILLGGDIDLGGNGSPIVSAQRFEIDESQRVSLTRGITSCGTGCSYPYPTGAYILPIPVRSDLNDIITVNGSIERTLTAGSYYLVSSVGELLDDVTVRHTIVFEQSERNCSREEYVGGTRVKKAVLSDGDVNTEDIIYEYFYDQGFVEGLNNLNDHVVTDSLEISEEEVGEQFDSTDEVNDSEDHDVSSSGSTISDRYNTTISGLLSSLSVHFNPNYFDAKVCDLVGSAYHHDPFAKTSGHHMGYSEVSVVKNGMSDGVTVYKYRNGGAVSSRGHLLSEAYYLYDDLGDTLIKKSQTDYDYEKVYYSDRVEGMVVDVVDTKLLGCVQEDPFDANNSAQVCNYYNIYDAITTNNSSFQYYTSFIPLTSKKQSTFSESDTLVSSTHYFHDFTTMDELVDGGIKLTETTREVHTTSTGDKYFTHYYYPHAYLDFDDLKDGYFTNYLMSKKSGLIDGSDQVWITDETIYEPDLGRVYQVWQKDLPIPEIDSEEGAYLIGQSIYPTSKNPSLLLGFTKKATYQYEGANLTEVIAENGLNESYVWGHGGRFLVAKISNATIDKVPSSAINICHDLYFDQKDDLSEIDDDISTLENAFSSLIADPDIMVTLYTHKEGRGITSQTDPNGQTTYYSYDSQGRLTHIKDDDGNMLERYHYNYKQ